MWVGLWPPPDIVDVLDALPREDAPGLRWATADQWHVTLCFLGRADPGAATVALSGLRHPATEARFEGRVGRLGRDALVVPVGGLESLATAVADAFRGVGDRRPEGRPYFGHLTLARLKGRPACGLVDRRITGSWTVGSVALVASELHAAGARYTTVATVPLLADTTGSR